MAGNDKRTTRRAPVVLRIKLRYRDIDTFVDRFATNIGTGGMFIASRKPKAPGTELKFALMLADESQLVAGSGIVRWVRAYDPDKPRRPHGMGIEFVTLEDGSQQVIDRVIAYRASHGLETDEIPLAEKSAVPQPASDEVSAPMAVETGPVPAFRERTPPPIIPAPAPPPSYDDSELDDLVDGTVDLASAVQRARALVGDGMEAELGKLLEDLPPMPRIAPAPQIQPPAPAPAPSSAAAPAPSSAPGDDSDLDDPTAVGSAFVDDDIDVSDFDDVPTHADSRAIPIPPDGDFDVETTPYTGKGGGPAGDSEHEPADDIERAVEGLGGGAPRQRATTFDIDTSDLVEIDASELDAAEDAKNG